MTNLTPQQERFVQEYLIDLNGTAAYQRAGYKSTGASATASASRVLANVHVQRAIDIGKAEREKRTQITGDQVLKNIARLATMAEDAKDLGNALRGNELLGKHLKLFTDKVEHSGEVNVTIQRFSPAKAGQ